MPELDRQARMLPSGGSPLTNRLLLFSNGRVFCLAGEEYYIRFSVTEIFTVNGAFRSVQNLAVESLSQASNFYRRDMNDD